VNTEQLMQVGGLGELRCVRGKSYYRTLYSIPSRIL